ncbi:MAG: hypothetical protein AAGF81_22470 [Pseudomonadota bacterium]
MSNEVEDQMNTLGEARKKLYEAYGEAASKGGAEPLPQKKEKKAKSEKPSPKTPQRKREDIVRRVAARIAAEMPEGTVASYIPVARAVLTELREPTNAMLEAAFQGHLDYSDVVEDWQRMIDAALEEPGFDS